MKLWAFLLVSAVFSASCTQATILPYPPDAGADSVDVGVADEVSADVRAPVDAEVDVVVPQEDAGHDAVADMAEDSHDASPDAAAESPTDSAAETTPDSAPDVPGDVPPALPSPSVAGQLVITEIMVDSAAAIPPTGLTSDDVGEWVEVLNPTDQALDVFGCQLSDTNNSDAIAAHLTVPAHGYVTLGRSAPGFAPDYVYGTVKFSDTGDRAAFTCGSVLIDLVNFATGFPLAQGSTLALDRAHLDAVANDAPTAWCAGVEPYNVTSKGIDRGTPGQVNPACPGL